MPRIVAGRFAPARRTDDVCDQHERGQQQQIGPGGRDGIEQRKRAGVGICVDAARHPHDAHKEHRQERDVEADEGQPKVDFTEPLVESPTEDFRPPVIDCGEQGEQAAAADRVVEVRDDEVGVFRLKIEWGRRDHDAGHASQQEVYQEPQRPQHRRAVTNRTTPHGANPIEELDPGRHRDEERDEAEEGIAHRSRCEHVMCPNAHREPRDGERGEHHSGVTEHGAA